MKKTVIAAAAMVVTLWTGAAGAQNGASPTVKLEVLEPNLAVELAQKTRQDCLDRGYQVAVAVVDRFGVMQAMVRSRYAGPHTVETARQKAYTAVSFRTDTLSLVEPTNAGSLQSGARQIPGVLMLGGGEPVRKAGSLIGAVGVSGGPTGEEDAACAKAGIEAIQGELAF